MTNSRELDVALEAARAAAEVIRSYYLGNLDVRVKEDQTPVTVADVETEEAIRTIIQDAFPGHGFYGEETGRTRMTADEVWLVDPIDGTKSFVRQYPFFSTQIALMRRGELVLGVSSAPAFDELAWAERGKGAYLNGDPCEVSDISSLASASLSAGNLKTLATSPAWSSYGRLVASVDRIRGYGDFYHYHLLLSGKLDLVVESDVNILDIAALSVIVEEAGGRFTNLNGDAVGLTTTSVLASNGLLHSEAQKYL